MNFRLFGDYGNCRHYQDNGQDFKYQNGEYNEYHVEVMPTGKVRVDLTRHGYQPTYKSITVITNNRQLVFNFNQRKGNYQLTK